MEQWWARTKFTFQNFGKIVGALDYSILAITIANGGTNKPQNRSSHTAKAMCQSKLIGLTVLTRTAKTHYGQTRETVSIGNFSTLQEKRRLNLKTFRIKNPVTMQRTRYGERENGIYRQLKVKGIHN